jgi:hypothetical protein
LLSPPSREKKGVTKGPLCEGFCREMQDWQPWRKIHFTRLASSAMTPEALKRAAEKEAQRKKRRKQMLQWLDVRNCDLCTFSLGGVERCVKHGRTHDPSYALTFVAVFVSRSRSWLRARLHLPRVPVTLWCLLLSTARNGGHAPCRDARP